MTMKAHPCHDLLIGRCVVIIVTVPPLRQLPSRASAIRPLPSPASCSKRIRVSFPRGPSVGRARRQRPPEGTVADVSDRRPAPRRDPKADETEDERRTPNIESDRRRPRSPPTSHDSARGTRRHNPNDDPTIPPDCRQRLPGGDGGRRSRSDQRPRRGPKADETEDEQRPRNTESNRRRSRPRPPLTVARAMAEGGQSAGHRRPPARRGAAGALSPATASGLSILRWVPSIRRGRHAACRPRYTLPA